VSGAPAGVPLNRTLRRCLLVKHLGGQCRDARGREHVAELDEVEGASWLIEQLSLHAGARFCVHVNAARLGLVRKKGELLDDAALALHWLGG